MHGIYKYVVDNEIIYIGKTDASFNSRIKCHAKEDKFKKFPMAKIYYFLTGNSTETMLYEKLLINKYQPVLNVVDRHDISFGIPFGEPEWMPYEELVNKMKRGRKKKEIKGKTNTKNKYLCLPTPKRLKMS